ncbi:YfhH family protein [Ornithinibacillus sp. 4-3]|uniref:YfhH family protein n=1 Tax=Ornithinibacillus sp. 4-3 TaxID=3231488 RepID=A0AB39HIC2_9BACI
MKFLYSDYTMEQLREELGKLKELALKAEQQGNISEVAIQERKMHFVRSYMLNPADFSAGDTHQIQGDPGHTFKINYINGIMAWGHRVNLLGEQYIDEEALPISLLGDKIETK